MNKQRIFFSLLGLIIVFLLPVDLIAQGFGQRVLVNEGWSFHLGDVKYGGAEYHDHTRWRVLDLPHDWSVEQPASPSYASCTGFLPGGIGWYRKELSIPIERKGEKVYVYFEGVYNNSEVYINGKWIGRRPNGYVSFMYDLTPYIRFGERNVIAVRVDHSQDADSRWYTGSGIYRDVYLVYANPVHIDQWGVRYDATVVNNGAHIAVRSDLKNTQSVPVSVKVIQELYDRNGVKVAAAAQSQKIAPASVATQEQNLRLAKVQRWSLDDPYLYTLRTFVFMNGKEVDRTQTRVGIRTLDYNPDKGFALNGRSMKMKGVCIHHDAGCLGSAVPKEVWRRRLLQLKEIGCNAIRMSHNPQATDLYDLCDEIGFLVMDEAFDEWEYPKKKWITGWNKGTPGFQGSAFYFREWCKQDLSDMIRRDRNHPSIVMWSIGNEVDYPNDPYSHPVLDKEGIGQQHVKGYLSSQPRAERLGDIAKELVAEVKKQDRSRPVTAALAGVVMSNETDYPGVLDIVGYNYTENRYAQDHQKYPQRVIYGSETRSDLGAWKSVRDNDYIFGQFIWTGFDYLGESGPWPSRGFTTGFIDLAGNIKPRGYFRRALWAETPVMYVGAYPIGDKPNRVWDSAPAVWNYSEGEMIRVVAYTNCEEAELYLNDTQVGERKKLDDSTGIIYWDLPYQAGTLRAVGVTQQKAIVSDTLISSGLPFKIEASFDRSIVKAQKQAVHLSITIRDEQGVMVPLADNQITCRIEGPARLLGLESGDNNVTDNYRDNVQRCRNGRLLGYLETNGKAGTVIVTLSSPLLKSTVLRLTVEE